MSRNTFYILISIIILIVSVVFVSCSDPEDYTALNGYWEVNSVDNASSTGPSSEPWIKVTSDEVITFVYYTSTPEWRHCTIRSGEITNITSDTITFIQDYGSTTKTIAYTLDGTTASFTWGDDSEIYHMSQVSDLPYTEASAVSSACFN
jgi:hypothetical protein